MPGIGRLSHISLSQLWCGWQGGFMGKGAKKSLVFGSRLASGTVCQSCSIRFRDLACRTPCSRLLPCDLDDACRAVKPARR